MGTPDAAWRYITTSSAAGEAGGAAGLDRGAIARIMLGPDLHGAAPRPLPGCPAAGQSFALREHKAAGTSLAALRGGRVALPDPWNGADTIVVDAIAVLPLQRSGIALPMVYRAMSQRGEVLFVSDGLTGRISQIIMTDGRLTVHELGPARAEGLAAYLAGTPDWRAMLQPVDGPAICVVDFVNNHGHHLLNHLSGLQRLVDEGLVDKPDAIWTRGQMHFGRPGRLFPEFADRLRHFGSQEDLRAALNATRGTKLRIGSNFFNAALRSRILGTNAFLSARSARGPVVCFTLRVAGRQCLNLEESILRIMQAVLERWPDAQVVFDGWTSHDDLAGVSSAISAYKASPYAKNIDAETAMVQSLAERLPPGVVRRNLVGYPMSETISVLQAVDFYFAHTGTIQHKIGFLTDAVGLIHGPRLAVSDPEAGAYCTESGNPPTQLAAELVEDVGEPSPRGARSNDYRIADPDRVAQLCCEMIAQARPDLLAAGAAGRATP